MTRRVDIAVVGAGQAGLSSGYFLQRAGLRPDDEFVVFDADDGPGGAWRHRWPTLTFSTVHGIHQLPGMKVPVQPDPDAPVAPNIARYFADYEDTFDLRVRRPVTVISVTEDEAARLRVTTDGAGDVITRGLINATGTWRSPFWPHYPGRADFRGRQVHTADYPGPAPFANRRVIVVGGGTSAIQHLMEIAGVAEHTTWVTRRPVEFTDRPFDAQRGREVEARVARRVAQGYPPESIIASTGHQLTPQVRRAMEAGVLKRWPMFSRLTENGAQWADGTFLEADTIVWATGFRSVLDHLRPLRLRHRNGGIAMDDTQVAADPRIHLVGYGPSASTIGANRAARRAVRRLRAHLGIEKRAPHAGIGVRG